MTVSRTRRFLAALLNLITFNLFGIGGLLLLLTKSTSFGGLVMGYKFENASGGKAGFGSLFVLWLMKILFAILVVITFGIMWLVDVIGMGNRNGTFAEKWAGVKKA